VPLAELTWKTLLEEDPCLGKERGKNAKKIQWRREADTG